MSAVKRNNLGDQIADRLRQEILLGTLTTGDPLSQQLLCERFETSRMPVRDALVRLRSEGLVALTTGGHYIVAGLSSNDVIDTFDIEALVHARAARRAVRLAEPRDIAELQRLHEEMLAASNPPDFDRLAELNWAFHRKINRLSGSTKLLAVIRSTSLDIPREFLRAVPDATDRSNAEHAEIIQAFLEGEPEKAESLVRLHVARAGADLAAQLEMHRALGALT